MSKDSDRLYNLLPGVYRQQDAQHDQPLRALLQIIAEQVDVVEENIDQLYENWFIETCEDWVVPYIADLLGYQSLPEAELSGDSNLSGRSILVPRKDVASTIRYRRRKGTLALLEELANAVGGWPARAVEFYQLVATTQNLKHLRPMRGRTVDLRDSYALRRLNSPFDQLAHTLDVRNINVTPATNRYGISNVGVFVWRLKAFSTTYSPACCLEEIGKNCYSFSILGNDTVLFNLPQLETDTNHIAEEINLPIPINRQDFEEKIVRGGITQRQASSDFYGIGKSIAIWAPGWSGNTANMPVPREAVIPTDLSNWGYRPPQGYVAVDPQLGRIVFPAKQPPPPGVKVTYHYGFSDCLGGGEYERTFVQPKSFSLYSVGQEQPYKTIQAALSQWKQDQNSANERMASTEVVPDYDSFQHAVIEISDSEVYTERLQLNATQGIRLQSHQSLQIRAANHKRPVIKLLDYETDFADPLRVFLGEGSQLVLDGLLITGRSIQISTADDSDSEVDAIANPSSSTTYYPAQVLIRHSTLVPGWTLRNNPVSKHPTKPSLEIDLNNGKVQIENSILGSIQVNQNEVNTDPVLISLSNSVLDATDSDLEALGAPGYPYAHARVEITETTVFGRVQVDSCLLAENSIFEGGLFVKNQQHGCIRFCSLCFPSRTPCRSNCQPDLAETLAVKKLQDQFGAAALTEQQISITKEQARIAVSPKFNSRDYGDSGYCQLATMCSSAIKEGASDQSEMGVFHQLYEPQKMAGLRRRLQEYTPADMNVGLIVVT